MELDIIPKGDIGAICESEGYRYFKSVWEKGYYIREGGKVCINK